MVKEKKNSNRGDRISLIVFWASSSLLLINILVGKGSQLWNWNIFNFGDLGEFLLLLTASISIIVVVPLTIAARLADSWVSLAKVPINGR